MVEFVGNKMVIEVVDVLFKEGGIVSLDDLGKVRIV